MLFGNVYIELPDAFSGIREDVEKLCSALEAQEYDQEHTVQTILQALLIKAAASVTEGVTAEQGFDLDQIEFCNECEADFVASSYTELRTIIGKTRTIDPHSQYQPDITLEDMRITAALVYLEEFQTQYEDHLLEQVALSYKPSVEGKNHP